MPQQILSKSLTKEIKVFDINSDSSTIAIKKTGLSKKNIESMNKRTKYIENIMKYNKI